MSELDATNVAEAVESNSYELFAQFRRCPQLALREDSCLAWAATGRTLAGFNGVFWANLEPERIDVGIEEPLKCFRGRELPIVW